MPNNQTEKPGQVTQPAAAFMIIPSLACPAACSYCFGPRVGAVMSEEQALKTIDYIARVVQATGQNKVNVTFHGGEPLMAGHAVWRVLLQSLFQRFGRHRLKLGLQSNLWLLDEEFCRLFKMYNVEIGTSLDGPEPITDQQRGKGYFYRTMQGMELARANRIPVDCIATFTAQNQTMWKEVVDFYRQAGLPFSIHPSLPSWHDPQAPHVLSPRDYGTLLLKSLAYYMQHRQQIKIHSLDQMIQGVAFVSGRVCTFRNCLGMFLAIDPLGDIYPCQRFAGHPEHRMGTVAEQPMPAALYASPMAQRLQARARAVQSACGACEHLEYCQGGCAYNAWSQKPPDQVQDPYCPAYQRIFSVIQKRLKKEMSNPANLAAITEQPFSGKGHPLLQVGPLSELCQPEVHPSRLRQKALETVLAALLAQRPNVASAAERLVGLGLFESLQQAQRQLQHVSGKIFRNESLNNCYLYITYQCQLQCQHCYLYSNDFAKPGLEMALESLGNFIGQAKAAGFRQVVILGGEPLLHQQLPELLKQLRSIRDWAAPMNLVLRTNFAWPLAPGTMAAIALAVDQIVVSVDGDEQTHDARRGPGSYAKTLLNLRAYQAQQRKNLRAAELSLAAVLPTVEISGEPGQSVRQLAGRLGIRRVRFRPLLPLGRAGEWQEPPMPETLCGFKDSHPELLPGREPTQTCGLGQNLYVAPDGEVFPCYAFCRPESRIGNLSQMPLAVLLDSEAFRALRQASVDTRPVCQTCPVRYLCGGACRAWAGKATGADFNAPPTDCQKQKKLCETELQAAETFLGVSLETLVLG